MRTRRQEGYYLLSRNESAIHAAQHGNWDDTESSRSRAVCDAAINAHDIPDQAEHIAALVVCCRASPTSSENRQRNESAVDVSCMYVFGFLIQIRQIPKRSDVVENLKKRNSTDRKFSLNSAHKHNCSTIMERYFIDEQDLKRMYEK